ncbi:MAG: hypothetical protein ACRBDX_01745 [Gammaproteobacteria bacterium]
MANFIACSYEEPVIVEKSSKKLSDDNVFKGYESAIDKAQGVEQMIHDAAELRRKEMEERGY